MTPDDDPILCAALEAAHAGLVVLPVSSRGKYPVTEDGTAVLWKPYRTRRPTRAESSRWFRQQHPAGLGVLAGEASGWLHVLDFDDLPTHDAFVARVAACGLGDAWQRAVAGYADATPGGGRRVLVRVPELPPEDVALAARPLPGEKHIKVLIETVLFGVCAPTTGAVHNTGRPYVRLTGGFATIATLDADTWRSLCDVARSLDERPLRDARTSATGTTATPGTRPGDDYNARTTWPEVLEPAGWRFLYERDGEGYWTRPGKPAGLSATTNYRGSDRLVVFTTSTEFERERSYDKFGAYATLHHHGDLASAAKALAAHGYGTPADASVTGTDADPGRPPDPFGFTSLADLLAEPDDAVEYVVEDRVPAGSITMLVGKPKAGKSTAARDLAFAVATGGAWLGHRTAPGSVWFLALEEKRSEVRKHFRLMGATGREPVRLFINQAPADLLPKLASLANVDPPSLIVIDTLQRFLRVKDLNDYAEVTTAFDPVLHLARSTGAALLLLHHGNKASSTALDSVLGSTALAGSVDNLLVLSRSDRYRTLSSIQRIGPDLTETLILLDPTTGRVRLGGTKHDAEVDEVVAQMIDALAAAKEPMTRADLDAAVEGRVQLRRHALKLLVSREHAIVSGKGTRNDPHRYVSCSLVPPRDGNKQSPPPDLSENPRPARPVSCSRVPTGIRVPAEQRDDRLRL